MADDRKLDGQAARRPHVVILGGGFGGLYAARSLRKADVDLTLVDRRNHHLFQPLLYQVASAALDPSDIAAPIRRILRHQRNASVALAEARAIDTRAKRIELTDGELSYDYLIVATGSTHSYFGHDEWASVAPGLKTIEDALEIRRRVLLAFEAADREPDPARREEWLTFVIVGAGPTGVELAGALAEISRHILSRDYRHLGKQQARVLLVEAGPRVLSAFPDSLGEKARRDLEELGVEVERGTPVEGIDSEGVTIKGQRIAARTVLWAAGVAASPLARSLGAPLDRAGRVKVNADLSVPGAPDVFVVGDLAATTYDGGKPVPGVAPAAMQGGRHAAEMVLRRIAGKPTEPFTYWNKGNLATIGRAKAVADFGKFRLSGFIAWMAWLLVHIAYLIGFRNRFFVLLSWSWTYLTYERGSRLITGRIEPLLEQENPHLRDGHAEPGSSADIAVRGAQPAPPH